MIITVLRLWPVRRSGLAADNWHIASNFAQQFHSVDYPDISYTTQVDCGPFETATCRRRDFATVLRSRPKCWLSSLKLSFLIPGRLTIVTSYVEVKMVRIDLSDAGQGALRYGAVLTRA